MSIWSDSPLLHPRPSSAPCTQLNHPSQNLHWHTWNQCFINIIPGQLPSVWSAMIVFSTLTLCWHPFPGSLPLSKSSFSMSKPIHPPTFSDSPTGLQSFYLAHLISGQLNPPATLFMLMTCRCVSLLQTYLLLSRWRSQPFSPISHLGCLNISSCSRWPDRALHVPHLCFLFSPFVLRSALHISSERPRCSPTKPSLKYSLVMIPTKKMAMVQ